MQGLLISIFTVLSVVCFWLFLRKRNFSPLWIMLSAWFIAIAISQLHLSTLELTWSFSYWQLVFVSLISFVVGVVITEYFVFARSPASEAISKKEINKAHLRVIIYILFVIAIVALYLFHRKAGDFPLLANDPDAFRFAADEKVPGLINYAAQLARIFIPLSFFLIFWQGFNWRKQLDLVIICLLGTFSLILFASRTQIFFIDLWVMALYLFIKKPNWKQAIKFYPIFLLISILVLAAVPLYRQAKSYGQDYLGNITGIDTTDYNQIEKSLIPIYVGVSFNQQALMHAWRYYQVHPIQHGKVSLDPFTNIFGKVIKPLNKLKPNYDLGAIFYSWWNTGTYLFPFVQDFGVSAFYWVPFVIGAILTLLWRYWQRNPNFLSINLYAYAMFFIVMTVYLSFTVRAEMYLDLMLLIVCYYLISKKYGSRSI
jgi:oligosaccharide repeat unit polymerase